jgi:hypothetical protein
MELNSILENIHWIPRIPTFSPILQAAVQETGAPGPVP